MKNKDQLLFVIAITLPIVILISLSFLPLITYFNGTEILLETKPVDPRDLFRGDYVNLRFVINDVVKDAFPDQLMDNDTFSKYKHKKMFAVLKKQGQYYVVDHLSFSRPSRGLYLWAKINISLPINELYGDTVKVQYPMDRYFVPEGSGTELENLSRSGNLVAKVRVWHGYPLLMEVTEK